tara:strand:+ start:1041 stop:1322 length:282 start_codon:yes stop_codon:yes gene_type:complete
MNPSKIATLAILIGAGTIGAGAGATPAESNIVQSNLKNQVKASVSGHHSAIDYMVRAGFSGGSKASGWRKLNQRQIRKNRRRANASGKRNAFA